MISPKGTHIAFSSNLSRGPNGWLTSCIFTVPITGGEPQRVTPEVPSFLHGWSPDEKQLLYTAERNGQFDIFRIGSTGGKEVRLTNTAGLSDGPEYSVDGKHIYYNAMDSGKMELWRMDSDGRNAQQLTHDAYSNWFPHPSPSGDSVLYIAYLQDQGSAHPAMKQVAIRLYDLKEKTTRTLLTFTGGQGSLNVPSWSANGDSFAFVSYNFRTASKQIQLELEDSPENDLSEIQKSLGWQLLFDGQGLSGWHGFNTKTFPDSWAVENGELMMLKDTGTPIGLTSDKEYGDFALSLEFKVAKGANSGLLFHVAEDARYGFAYETGSEYQIIDHEGWKTPLEEDQICGANYAMHAPRTKAHKPAGEWNKALLIVSGNEVIHFLNGVEVVRYEKYSPEWTQLRQSGKWADFPDYGTYDKGHLVLQHFGDHVSYRNIKLKELNPMKPDEKAE